MSHHFHPESWATAREGRGQALTGARAGRAIEHRKEQPSRSRGRDRCSLRLSRRLPAGVLRRELLSSRMNRSWAWQRFAASTRMLKSSASSRSRWEVLGGWLCSARSRIQCLYMCRARLKPCTRPDVPGLSGGPRRPLRGDLGSGARRSARRVRAGRSARREDRSGPAGGTSCSGSERGGGVFCSARASSSSGVRRCSAPEFAHDGALLRQIPANATRVVFRQASTSSRRPPSSASRRQDIQPPGQSAGAARRTSRHRASLQQVAHVLERRTDHAARPRTR